MKKILCLLMTFAMLLSLSVAAFAADTSVTEVQRMIEQDGYSFTITEKTNTNYAVSRKFVKDTASARTAVDLEETKALLVSLGMKESAVNKLTTETLQDLANSSNIVVTTSYTKFNEENGTSTAIPKATALAEASTLQSAQEAAFMQTAQNISTFGIKDNESDRPGEFRDSYMEVIHTAAYQGGGSYLFMVDAKWLTMPTFRGYDSIGSCAMNGTVSPNTQSGYYSYDTTTIDGFGRITHSSTGDITITNKQNETNGNWYGSAGIIDLPNNISTENTSTMHSNLEAHYQYEGHVNYPELVSWFNTVGTYSHATISLVFSPSVSIDIGGGVSASIGLSIAGIVDSRPAELEIKYIP